MSRPLNWQTQALHLLGDYRAELATVRRARKRFPQDPDGCAFELRALTTVSPRGALLDRLSECFAHTHADAPDWPAAVRLRLAAELRTHGETEMAKAFADTAVAIYQTRLRRDSLSLGAAVGLARALLERGEYRRAQRLFERELKERGRPALFLLTHSGIAAALAGDQPAAEAALRRLAAENAPRSPVAGNPYQRGRILAALGRRDEAVEMLRKAVAGGLSAAELFHADIALEPLHGYPPFEALVGPRPRPVLPQRVGLASPSGRDEVLPGRAAHGLLLMGFALTHRATASITGAWSAASPYF